MDPPVALIAAAGPSETALLDFVRARVSREMIREIAMNDYGNNAEVRVLAILEQLVPNPVLGVVPYDLKEALELEQWTCPGSADIEGHRKRLLACIILLRNDAFVSGDDDLGDIQKSPGKVIWLVRSSITLGSDASRLALGFLLWLHVKQSDPRLRAFVSFGALLLQIQEGLCGSNLLDTCTWVEHDEKMARELLHPLEINSATWLLGLSAFEDCGGHREPWTDTFAQVVAARSGQLPPEVESALRRLLDRLRE